MQEKNPNSIKLIAVGDGNVGKHDLLLSYIKDKLSLDFIPQVFENYTIQTVVDGKMVNLNLWDTAGQETYNRLRILSYGQADNAITKWYQDEFPELKCVPKIFVGNNKEMRNIGNPNHIQYEAAKSQIDQLQCQYLECSGQTQDGLKEIFDLAIIKALQVKGLKSDNSSNNNQKGQNKKKEKCQIFDILQKKFQTYYYKLSFILDEVGQAKNRSVELSKFMNLLIIFACFQNGYESIQLQQEQSY